MRRNSYRNKNESETLIFTFKTRFTKVLVQICTGLKTTFLLNVAITNNNRVIFSYAFNSRS